MSLLRRHLIDAQEGATAFPGLVGLGLGECEDDLVVDEDPNVRAEADFHEGQQPGASEVAEGGLLTYRRFRPVSRSMQEV